jgi:hypothetical protein
MPSIYTYIDGTEPVLTGYVNVHTQLTRLEQ